MDEPQGERDLIVYFQKGQLNSIIKALVFALGLSLMGIGMLIVQPPAGSASSGLALMIAEVLSPFLFIFSVTLLITIGKRLKVNDPAMVLANDRVELQPLGFPRLVVGWEDIKDVGVYEQVAGKNRQQLLCIAVNGVEDYVRKLRGFTRLWANLSMSSRGTPFQFSINSLDQSIEAISRPFLDRNLGIQATKQHARSAEPSNQVHFSHPLVGGWADGGPTLAPGNHSVSFRSDGTGTHWEYLGASAAFRWRPLRQHAIEVSPAGYSQWWEVIFLLDGSEVSFCDPDDFVGENAEELPEELERADDFFRDLCFGSYSK